MDEITTINKLYSIFQNKKWTEKDGNEIVFSNFCFLISNLTNPQRKLLIDLADRYTWISLSEYEKKLITIMDSVEQEKLEKLKKIILFPVMKPEDEKKTKSGHTILYLARALKPLFTKYKHIEFIEIEEFDKLDEMVFQPKDNECIFLLDDYLGSGETIESTLTRILKNRKIGIEKLNVVSIAAQKDTIKFLKDFGISLYTDFISLRGISDFYVSPELEEKVQIMKGIEKLIADNHFSFGYMQSEALITLLRTPDNTFPIFWKEYKKDDVKFEAPFSRY